MSSKYEEILEEARKKFQQILEEFEKQETRGEPMKPDPFDVSKLAELLSNLSKEEGHEREPTVQLNIVYSDFEILINLLVHKIPSSFFNHKDFIKLVNLFNYMYLNKDYKKTEQIEEFRKKLIHIFQGSIYEWIFLEEES